ncbi:MAG: DUF4352 domain-containing protein [Actinobacteria bacterium]|nr:DUF4352 domain-containing protein [Actinomycetota bacterium]
MARRKIILTVIAAIIAVALIAIATFFFMPREVAPPEPEMVGTFNVNEPFNVGGVRWQVTQVETETSPIVVEEFFEERFETEGRFVFVELSVELIARESSFLSSDEIALVDDRDRIYRISSTAIDAITSTDRDSLPTEVHPNIPVQGFIGFEVAQNSRDLRLRIERRGEAGFVRLNGFD